MERDKNVEFSHVVVGVGRDADNNLYLVRAVINKKKESVHANADILIHEVMEGAKAKNTGFADYLAAESSATQTQSKPANIISIADLIEIVKDNYPAVLSQDILDRFGIVRPPDDSLSADIKYSLSDKSKYAPIFFSKLAQVVNTYKGEKVAGYGIVNYLKLRGVKAEEIVRPAQAGMIPLLQWQRLNFSRPCSHTFLQFTTFLLEICMAFVIIRAWDIPL